MKDSIIFYKSFYEAIKELPKENQLELYDAIFEKYFYNNDRDLEGITKGIFKIIIPNIDSANARYFANKENGKKGGRPKKPKENPNESKMKPKENPNKSKKNLNVNDNVNDNVNVNNKKKIQKEKYGVYGRVKLTIDEYLKLVNEFGEEFIKKQIDLLDEYIESNNNKNKYTNFNLVLRKSIREKWFEKNNKNGGSSNVFLDIMKEDYGR